MNFDGGGERYRSEGRVVSVGIVDLFRGECIGSAFFAAGFEGALTATHVLQDRLPDAVELALGQRMVKARSFGQVRQTGFVELVPMIEIDVLRFQHRNPMAGELVDIVGWPQIKLSDVSMGPRVVRTNVMAVRCDGRLETYGILPKGFSGAPIVAVSDSRVIGMVDGVRIVDCEVGSGFPFAFCEGLVLV